MAKKIIKKEIEDWLESDNETALIEIVKITDDKIDFNIGEDEEKFSVTYPKDYPNSTEKFVSFFKRTSFNNSLQFVFSEEETLSEWQQQLNEYAEKPKIKVEQLLTKAADLYLAMTVIPFLHIFNCLTIKIGRRIQ
jgi:hypothetical protein